MKIIHTSDWHLGQTFNNQNRDNEFASFCQWLIGVIKAHQVDGLVVAGDIFDVKNPSIAARKIYYSFLSSLIKEAPCCRHIILTAGNHDSAALLDAPALILEALNVKLVTNIKFTKDASGQKTCDLDNEVQLCYSPQGQLELIVAAVPFFSPGEVRASGNVSESIEERRVLDAEAVARHFDEVFAYAAQKRGSLDIPIIGMGHLWVSGAKLTGDSEHSIKHRNIRENVGNLEDVQTLSVESIDYLALGHLHGHQQALGSEKCQYSGSPLQLSFSELKQQKSINLLDFSGRQLTISRIDVPKTCDMRELSGDWPQLESQLTAMVSENKVIWLSVKYTGSENRPSLNDDIRQIIKDSQVIIMAIDNPGQAKACQSDFVQQDISALNDCSAVFSQFLNDNNYAVSNDTSEEIKAKRQELEECFNEILAQVLIQGGQAETGTEVA